MSNKIYTGISSNYVPNWGVWEGMRELIANALDMDSHSIEQFNAQGQRWLSIQSFGGVMPKEMFLLGNSGKREDGKSIGTHGEGAKLSMLVLLRAGKDIRIKNGFDKIIPTIEEHPQLGGDCLAIEIVEGFYGIEDTDGNSVDITIHNLTDEDCTLLDHNYLKDDFMDWVPEGDLLVNYDGCQIFRYDTHIPYDEREDLCDSENPKKVFVNGLFVCDLPDNYVFSYNLTPDRIELDRDRKSVDTWDLQQQVADLLELSGSFELMVQMSEERVPDLYEYYTPSQYRKASGGGWCTDHTESVNHVLNKLATENFIKRNGDKAIAINIDMQQSKRDIIKNRLKLMGYTPVEVPKTNYKMLDKIVTEIPDCTPVEGMTPRKMVEQFMVENKKHMRSKARKQLEKLIEDLVLIS